MGIVVIGAVFVDIKGYPEDVFIPTGRNVGRVEHVHGGVCRNVAEDIANVELRPTFVSLVENTGIGADVLQKLRNHKVNTDYIRTVEDGMGTWLVVFGNDGDVPHRGAACALCGGLFGEGRSGRGSYRRGRPRVDRGLF